MDQVIIYDKSLQQRLQEYEDVLSGYDILPVSNIQREWSFFLELALDPNGWQAIWKIQRKTCEQLKIPFPSIVLVLVLGVNLKELAAEVRILAVQDDIDIPAEQVVPLIQLWPTKDQDKSVPLDIQLTSNSLDMLRFFYHHLIMPWDYEEEDTIDWKHKHLEARLRLYYDMRTGVIPRGTGEHIRSLISEAKRLQLKREDLESQLEDVDDLDHESINNKHVQELMEIHIRLIEIRGEFELLENPLLRHAMIKKQQEESVFNSDSKQNIWLIYKEGKADDYIKFLNAVKEDFPSENLKFSSQLHSTLESANPNDIYLLNEAKHVIKTTGALENGGILKGMFSRDKTILTSAVENAMLDVAGKAVLLENLTIQAFYAQCAIIVRKGKLTLNNCKLIGDGKSSIHQGIIVLSGGQLELKNCEITNFFTALVGNSGSSIVMINSKIHEVDYGLKIYDNCTVNANNTTISNCKEYGICVETEKKLEGVEPRIGNFDTLKIIPQLQLECVCGDNNAKGDAVINQKSMLSAVENLFEDTTILQYPTVSFESDEEMEEQNVTVIETGRVSPATV